MGETIVVDRLFEVRGSSHFVTLFGHHKIKGVAKFVNSTFAFFLVSVASDGEQSITQRSFLGRIININATFLHDFF
jgi:hypothetical protein